MAATPERAAFDRGIRPVLQLVLPDKAAAVLNFRPPAELQARIEQLAGKASFALSAAGPRARIPVRV